ncbi:hypothetical protein AAFC00_001755 [Neodothiora populina]|uniref:Restriction of telomere capping protein 4 n=1 Tax=Neodothiora populina TaxID=2781224 RepID=A0ABR3PQ02_9PEZI
MNGLTRAAKPLLRTVNNKPHATVKDHEENTRRPLHQIKNTTLTEDVYREPESGDNASSGSGSGSGSEDDQKNIKGYNARPPQKLIRAPRSTEIHGSTGSKRSYASLANPKVSSRRTVTDSGRAEVDADSKIDDYDDNEAENIVFSQSSQKRQRVGYGKSAALKRPKGLSSQDGGSKRNASGASQGSTTRSGKSVSFRPPSGVMESTTEPSAQQGGPKFRRPVGYAAGHLPSSTESPPHGSRSRSSSLSSLSSHDEHEVIEVKPPASSAEHASAPCPICGEEVDETFKQDFLIERCGTKRMNFRLQELFCKLHKARAAKKTWEEREYPEIDWATLPARLGTHNQRIHDVLCGTAHSPYRDELEKRLRSGKSKTPGQTLENEAHGGSQVGYYGSKGEKVMTAYILQTFGTELRQRAGSDRVISAKGVSGGVSGYLQSVLVPEMALALVMEDADCSVEKARQILAESSDIGDALNEAEEETVPQSIDVSDADDRYGAEEHYDDDLLNI